MPWFELDEDYWACETGSQEDTIEEELMYESECADENGFHRNNKKYKEGSKCERRSCKGIYISRRNNKTNQEFLGCSEFPECPCTKEIK